MPLWLKIPLYSYLGLTALFLLFWWVVWVVAFPNYTKPYGGGWVNWLTSLLTTSVIVLLFWPAFVGVVIWAKLNNRTVF